MTASGFFALAQPASAGQSHLGTDLMACQQDGHITLPNGAGEFVCPDSAYKNGNLGKNWNELDLVPHRITLTDSAAETVEVKYGGDHLSNGSSYIGWDTVSELVLNDRLSLDSCDATPGISAPHIVPNATGGVIDTIERTASIAMPDTGAGACVYDYHQRLALGAHLYSGASLQSYFDGGGKETLSLPVHEALPQELGKTMSAVRDATQIWSVSKKAEPATVTFGDTCLTGADTKAPVDITVSWTKLALTPSGQTTVLTTISAHNPAARPVDVYAHDDIYAGATATGTALYSFDTPTVTVGAGATVDLVKDKQITLPSSLGGTTITTYNDVATGHYTDTVENVPIPQTTTATATAVVASGSTANGAVTISDTESITGAGFAFSVAAPDSGSFDGYTAGTKTTGEVTWVSDPQTGDGSVTFHKTVYADMGTVGNGTLSDVADVLNGDTVLTSSDTLDVPLSADTKVSLTVDKTLDPAVDRDLTFHFDVSRDGTTVATDVPITLLEGDTAESTTLTGLAPGTYQVHEQASYPFAAQDSADLPLDGKSAAGCAGSVKLENSYEPPVVQVQKVTVPTGHEGGWFFTLKGGDLPAAGVTVQTDGSGYVPFGIALGSGTYTVTEAAQTNWDLTGVAGAVSPVDATLPGTIGRDGDTCKLTVDQLLDADRTFSCTFTNTARGSITVVKQTVPAKDDQSFPFTVNGAGGVLDSFSLKDGQTNTTGSLQPGTYSAAEDLPLGWDTTDATCTDGSDPTAIDLAPGENVTCTFVNTKRGHIFIDKMTDPAKDPQLFDFTLKGSTVDQAFTLADTTDPHDSGAILAGTYSAAELGATGWDFTGATCSDGSPANAIVLSAGENITCTFSNAKRGTIIIDKVTLPAKDTQQFAFSLAGGPDAISRTFSLADETAPYDSGLVRSGTYVAGESALDGWDLTGMTCSDGSPVTAIALAAGETVTCTFTNTKRAHVTVVKKENGSAPTAAFTFRLRGGPASVDISRTTSSANAGSLDFGVLKPGPDYTMCELGVGVGTHSTLEDVAGATVDHTTGDVCVTFTLTAGQDKVFTVNNTHPGGDTRTIGYWKNWNTCAKATLAKAAKTGNHLMDEFLPVKLADAASGYAGYTVSTCKTGVAVLAAASAKYAENQLAAQLLAARLNVAAGAKVSPTTTAKIAHAMALLTQMKYKGPPSAIIGSSDPRRADVLATATYLDRYNNGLVV